MDEHGYWSRMARGRYSRRRVLAHVAVGLASLSSVGLLACGQKKSQAAGPTASGAGSATPKPGGTYSTYDAANISSLDPQSGQSASSALAIDGVTSYLYRFKTGPDPRTASNYEPIGDLALSAESPDAVTWTIKLRKDAKFQNVAPVNGHAVEAEDIKSSFVRALQVTANAFVSTIAVIDPAQIQTPATDTIVFKLKTPFSPFVSALANSGAEILPREALAGVYDPRKQLIGSGPFSFDSYTPDVGWSLKKNPQWFQANHPYVDAVHAAIIPDAAQQLAQFAAGHLDEITPSPVDVSTVTRSNPKAQVFKGINGSAYLINGHSDHPTSPYADVNVRRALSMAIDRDTIGKAVYNNAYVNNGIVPAGLGQWALAPDQLGDASQYFQYNLDAAKKLVQQTPAAKKLNQLLYPGSYYGQQFDTMCQTAGAMLNAAGFEIQIVAIDYLKDFTAGGKGTINGFYPDTALMVSPMSVHSDAVGTLEMFYMSTGGRVKQLNDPQLDAMLVKAQGIVDDKERLKAVQDIQRYIASEMYIVPLPINYIYTLVQPAIQSYYYGGAGTGTWPWLWINQ